MAILAITLGLFASLLYLWLSASLYGHHDEELRALAEEADARSRQLGPILDERSLISVLDAIERAGPFVMVRNATGALVYRSAVLDSIEPDAGRNEALVHAATSAGPSPQFFTVTLERSGPVRFICARLGSAGGVDGLYLQVGRTLGDVPTMMQAVSLASVVLLPTVLLLTSFGGWFIARCALAPMELITSKIRSIQATDLSRRIDVQPVDQELAGLVATLNMLLGRLERAFTSLREFVGDVSHQLQTPLTLMSGLIEVELSRGNDAARDPALLKQLAREISEMSAIVSDLSALGLAEVPLDGGDQAVDLSTVCQDGAEIVEALAEPHGVSVHVEIESGVRVQGDATRLKQVLLNLGSNAVKYTPHGRTVLIELRRSEGAAVLRVADTGIGISDEELPRVFDRFYRSSQETGGVQGTGLGLAIAKKIVEAHGGQMSAESRKGEGSRFTVELPLAS